MASEFFQFHCSCASVGRACPQIYLTVAFPSMYRPKDDTLTDVTWSGVAFYPPSAPRH